MAPHVLMQNRIHSFPLNGVCDDHFHFGQQRESTLVEQVTVK